MPGGYGAVEPSAWPLAKLAKVPASPADPVTALPEEERRKASLRAKVEHPFLYVKRRFGYAKVRYRGLEKNKQRIALLLGFANLLIAGRYAAG